MSQVKTRVYSGWTLNPQTRALYKRGFTRVLPKIRGFEGAQSGRLQYHKAYI